MALGMLACFVSYCGGRLNCSTKVNDYFRIAEVSPNTHGDESHAAIGQEAFGISTFPMCGKKRALGLLTTEAYVRVP
jgi:hypothetical protein